MQSFDLRIVTSRIPPAHESWLLWRRPANALRGDTLTSGVDPGTPRPRASAWHGLARGTLTSPAAGRPPRPTPSTRPGSPVQPTSNRIP